MFHLDLQLEVTLKPGDNEVGNFPSLTTDEVKEALVAGKLRPSSALVLLELFVRHGLITPENEPDYVDWSCLFRRGRRNLR